MKNLRSKFKDEFDTLKELPDYERAEVIVEAMFKDVKDKEGKPYIEHLLFVSNEQPTEEGKIVGLLHDLIEDTDTTPDELVEVGFSKRVIYSLSLLTKQKGTNYSEYIDTLIQSEDEIALRVKEADMRNNMDPERIARLSPEYQEKFKKKYPEQYEKIKSKLGEIENDRYKVNTRTKGTSQG